MPVPWCGGEPVDHTGFDVDADVEFDTVFSSALSFNTDVVPGATVLGTKSGAVNSNAHLFSAKASNHPVHHLAYIGDGESFHPSLDYAMPWENRAVLSKGLAVFDVCFNTVVGLIESYFKKTTDCYSLGIMSFSSSVVRCPWWW